MVAFHQVVVLVRILRGLLAGRDGEDLVAEVRALPVTDPTTTLGVAALVAVLTFTALGFAEATGNGHGRPIAAAHEIRTSVDL